MLLLLAQVARANPPRAEVSASWSGSAKDALGTVTVQPALIRSGDASVVVRATTGALHHEAADFSLETLGVGVGPGFSYNPGNLSLGLAVGLWSRIVDTTVGGVTTRQTEFDASLDGQVYWRPAQRAQLYGLATFDSAHLFVWARAGATLPVLTVSGDRPVGLWLGFEGTSTGTFGDRQTGLGPVAEMPLRDLRAVVGVHAAVPATPVEGNRFSQGTLGLSVWWSY